MSEGKPRCPDDIEIAIEERVARVVIRRPDRRNAMRLDMWRGMAQVFQQLGADPEIRAIVLTGAGADFSVGADVSEFGKLRTDAALSAAYEDAVDDCSAAIASVSKPTIAALHGYCLGGGCHLAMACDFRVADETAMVGIPAARLSIIYGVRSTQRLLNLVGLSNAKRMLFTAARFTAAEAHGMGFIDHIAASALDGAGDFAAKMAGNAPLSVAGAKFILDGLASGSGGLDEAVAQRLIDAAANSHDFREGVAAFAEKRNADFKGR
jgi:enoyl-CoA hydratase/carnithine racemase